MGIRIDKFLLCVIVFLAAWIALSLAGARLWICALGAFGASILCALLLAHRRARSDCPTYRDYITYCILEGDDVLKPQIADMLGEQAQDMGEYFAVGDTAYFYWLKFGSLGADTVVRYYRLCKQRGFTKAVILTASKDRKLISIGKRISACTIVFRDFHSVYRYHKRRDTLPRIVPPRLRVRETLALALSVAFAPSNAKRFVWIALVLFGLSFLTPLRTYYLILAAVQLILAAICLIRRDRD